MKFQRARYVPVVFLLTACIAISWSINSVAADPDQCPQYSAFDIDYLADSVGLGVLEEADLSFLLCEDDPLEPHTRFLAVWASVLDPNQRCRLAFRVDFTGTRWELSLRVQGDRDACPGVGPNTAVFDLSSPL